MASGTFPAAINGFGMSGYWKWTSTPNSAANKSSVVVTLHITKSSGSTTYSDKFAGAVVINGVSRYIEVLNGSYSVPYDFDIVSTSPAVDVTHDASGAKSITITADFGDVAPPLSSWTSSYGSATVTLDNFTRLPNAPASAPTINRSGTSLTIQSAVSAPLSPVGPSITYEYHVRESSDNGVTWSAWTPSNTSLGTAMATPPSATAISGLSLTKYYQYQTRAKSSEGFSAWSASATAYSPPVFQNTDVSGNITTFPDTATFGLPFNGTISATNADSITLTASTPAGTTLSSIGLTTTSSTVSGTTTLTIGGAPTNPGVYTFQFTATGPGGTTVSSIQTLAVAASAPWVKIDPVVTAIEGAIIEASSYPGQTLATVAALGHTITEKNQPITISDIEGTFSGLNGTWSVLSSVPGVSVSFLTTLSPTTEELTTGNLTVDYTRGSVKVFATGWVPQTSGATGTLLQTKYAGGLWLACGQGTSIFSSADGITWASNSTPSTAAYIMDVDYGSIDGVDGWIAFDQQGNKLTSFDGATWTLTSSIFGAQAEPVRRVRYANSLWVTVGGGGKIATSANGLDWTVQTSGVSTVLYGLAYGDGKWIADGNSTVVSTDGITWTSATAIPANAIRYSGGRFVAVGPAGAISTSDDGGTTWVSRTSGVTTPLWGISNFETTWIAVGGGAGSTSNLVLISTDNGTTWTVNQPTLGVTAIWGVDFNDDGLALVTGNSGKVATFGLIQRNAFMRVYDLTYTDASGTHWRPLA